MATAGSRCVTLVASRTISAMPMTNSGTAARTRVMVESAWSTKPSRHTAETTPMASESGIAKIADTTTRKAEFTTRGAISVETGPSDASDSPKLPCRMPPIQVVYWLSSGWLRCSALRSAASRSGVAVLPRIACAASPGSACVAAKTRMETQMRVTMPRPKRRTRTRIIGHGAGTSVRRSGHTKYICAKP